MNHDTTDRGQNIYMFLTKWMVKNQISVAKQRLYKYGFRGFWGHPNPLVLKPSNYARHDVTPITSQKIHYLWLINPSFTHPELQNDCEDLCAGWCTGALSKTRGQDLVWNVVRWRDMSRDGPGLAQAYIFTNAFFTYFFLFHQHLHSSSHLPLPSSCTCPAHPSHQQVSSISPKCHHAFVSWPPMVIRVVMWHWASCQELLVTSEVHQGSLWLWFYSRLFVILWLMADLVVCWSDYH
jgi:hypothetical protein